MDDALARAAAHALIAQAELTPKPGLADARDLRARTTGTDLLTLRWSAKALTRAFAALAASARRPGGPTRELREELGAIGRGAEWTMSRACGGPAAGRRRGALWAARAGFPHVRRALDALSRARGAGATEAQARLDALLTVMSTLQDTGPLYHAGPPGLRRVQDGARGVLEAGGTATAAGAAALGGLDAEPGALGVAPRGSAAVLAGALFLDSLPALPARPPKRAV